MLTLAWKAIRPLWQYAAIFLTLFLALSLTGLVRDTACSQGNFNYAGVSPLPTRRAAPAIFLTTTRRRKLARVTLFARTTTATKPVIARPAYIANRLAPVMRSSISLALPVALVMRP